MIAEIRTYSVRIFHFAVFLIIFPLWTFGQTGEIHGTVRDKIKGEPIIYVNVVLQGQNRGSTTDINGFYSIGKLSAGTYTVVCTTLGYDTVTATVAVNADKKSLFNIYLTPTEIEFKEVQISKNKTQKESRVEVSKIEVTPRQIEIMPSIGGEPDLAQYLQVIPGIVSTGDQGGQLYIRGGSPIQNKVLLDGMTIYNPFHSIGLFSVFDVDAIRHADIFTGGFDASYGGRISAVMDITTRDGNQSKFGGKINVSPFTSKLMLEGPIRKFRENEGGISYLFSGRTSYLQQTAPLFYRYAGTNGLPYNFTDLYGKLSFNAAGGSSVNLFGFNFSDNVSFPNSTSYGWNSFGTGAKILMVPSASSAIVEGTFAYSNYSSHQQEKDGKPRFSDINGFEAGINFSYYKGKNLLKYGLSVNGFKTNFQYTNSSNRNVSQEEFTTELAGYLKYNIVLKKLVLDPGLRLQYYASLSELSPEPRLGIKYNLTKNFRLKGAGGFYSQNLLSAQSDRDVVNLFYGFLSGPDELPETFDGNNVNSHLQKAWHAIGGAEAEIGEYGTFSVEPYLKKFTQLTNINRNKIFDNFPEYYSKPEELRLDYIVETGKAYGVDLLYTYDKKPVYLWLGYSLSKVTRFDGNETYFPHWDRRHNVNLLASYLFGHDKSWEFAVRWNFGTGFPFTKTLGFYELLNFQQGVSTDYTRNNGDLGILYSTLNGGRLSDFHRMDASLKKSWQLRHQRALKAVFSVTNVYNRENVFYFDRINYTRVNQLPILPSIAINYSF